MGLFSWIPVAVLAAGSIISPLPDGYISQPVAQPRVSFGQLISSTFASVQSGVLGSATASSETGTPEATPTPTPMKTRKSSYTIALLGDSMIDTLGPNAPHLRDTLGKIYRQTEFHILNYGVGATNIDYGLERMTHEYTYLGTPFPPLVSTRPDILVVESFGYNPFPYDTGALDHHWLQLAHIMDVVRASLPGTRVIIASTIAPNSLKFGDGAPGLSFSLIDKYKRTTVIKKYLENAIKFAQSQKLPLADAYHPSLDLFGNGKLKYINAGDNIHYSDLGRQLFAQKVTETIMEYKLLE